eukprot:COSAG02_NODE_1337_length_13193_cov_9.142050_11_plen_111_part_00
MKIVATSIVGETVPKAESYRSTCNLDDRCAGNLLVFATSVEAIEAYVHTYREHSRRGSNENESEMCSCCCWTCVLVSRLTIKAPERGCEFVRVKPSMPLACSPHQQIIGT